MSGDNLFSALWHRAAHLRPRLRPHIQLHRQSYRGDLWYVVQDHSSGRFYRFTPAAHSLIGLMDGQRTLEDIWELAGNRLGDDLPSQDETIQLISQLHAAGMIATDGVPDVDEIAGRATKQRRQKFWRQIRNPLGIRVPLFDPDRFLDATYPIVRPIFSRIGLVLWGLFVAYGVVLTATHWAELTHDVADRVMAADNLLLLALAYPLIKALHELGHGYAVKRWGGEVHELGIMFMVFMPIPYVDASSSTGFRGKHQRMLVGSAGIMVELAVATGALIMWTLLEPGFLRALAYNVMFIGGVSTLLFNGNPLLRFDGYYVFSDLIEIPNLGMRSNRYVQYLVRRYVYGVRAATSPVTASGERSWLFGYAVAATVYRLFIMAGIILFVASQFFFIGVALAIWGAFMMFVVPVGKWLVYLASAPELTSRRARAAGASAAVVAAILVPLLLAPVPHATVAEGVVWVPDQAQVYAGTAGFVREVRAAPGGHVVEGQTLLVMDDPILKARGEVLAAGLEEATVRLAALEITDRVKASVSQEQVRRATASLARVRVALDALAVESRVAGRFVVPSGVELEGRFFNRGELIGYVVGPENWVLRVAVSQDQVDLIANRTTAVAVRFAGRAMRAYEADIERIVPRATKRLPSAALGSDGGGSLLLDPSDPEGLRTLESLFVVDLALREPPPDLFFGARVHARFDHGASPLGEQAFRAVRQALLKRFDL